METESSETSANQLGNNNPPPPPEPPQIVSAPSNEERGGQQRQERHTPPQEPVRIVIEQDHRKEIHPLIANIISFLTLCAAIAAFIYTYKLFDAANTANETSAQGVAAANTADSISRVALIEQKETYRLQRISDSVKDISDSAKYVRDTTAENARNLANVTNQERLYKVQQEGVQAQTKSVNAQTKAAQAQLTQLSEMQLEYKNNHMPLLDYEKTIVDSLGEIVIINKGLGLAQIVSVEFIKGSRLGNYWQFLESIFSPNNPVANFSSFGIPLVNGMLTIQKNVAGFEYQSTSPSAATEFGETTDNYYCNKMSHTFINPSESKTLLKVISNFPQQMLPARFTIKYLSSFGDTLTLTINEYK